MNSPRAPDSNPLPAMKPKPYGPMNPEGERGKETGVRSRGQGWRGIFGHRGAAKRRRPDRIRHVRIGDPTATRPAGGVPVSTTTTPARSPPPSTRPPHLLPLRLLPPLARRRYKYLLPPPPPLPSHILTDTDKPIAFAAHAPLPRAHELPRPSSPWRSSRRIDRSVPAHAPASIWLSFLALNDAFSVGLAFSLL